MIIRNLFKLSFIWNFHNEKCKVFNLTSFDALKHDSVIKIKEMFSFLPQINNSVTIELSFFITKHVSNYFIKSN